MDEINKEDVENRKLFRTETGAENILSERITTVISEEDGRTKNEGKLRKEKIMFEVKFFK